MLQDKLDMMKRIWSTCLIFGLLSGCAVGPDYRRPPIDTPQNWRVDYPKAAEMADTAWWESFNDPVLDTLIQTALLENKDLRIATLRVKEFTSKLQVTRSAYYPQIDYSVSESHDQTSLNTPTPLPYGVQRLNMNLNGAVNASWELDFWGRVRRASEAARANLLSAEEGRRSVILSLVSGVATGYIDLLAADTQLKITQKTVASRKESLRLFELKFKGGAASELELSMIRSSYEEAAAHIPDIERRIALLENALSILLGKNPGPIERSLDLETLALPPVPQGIPSELLARRPDILQKEQGLIAANANIGLAKAEYFPVISLTGLYGYASTQLSNFLESSSSLWGLGSKGLGPIFTGGRIAGEIGQAEAAQQEALIDYLRTIQTAFREVNDSLVSNQKHREELDIQRRLVSALNDYVRLSRRRYDDGYSTYLEVLEAERSLFYAENALVQSQHDLDASLVNIYMTMGGGWVTVAAQMADVTQTKPAQSHSGSQ
jgi:multidrug efflux system outer membrane protein